MASKVPDCWIRSKSDEAAIEAGCYFDLEAAERVRSFFRKFLVHTDGVHAGKPFELLQWQWERVIAPAFGWKMPDGARRFRDVEVWIPKKNGKSTLMAGIALYLLCGDKEFGANVYTAASDRRQAGIIFNETVKMIRANPLLDEVLKVRISQKQVRFHQLNAFYEVLSADAFRNEGLNIHGLLFDELHAQPDRRLYDTLRYGGSARRQPINFVISTAGEHDEESLWWERFHHSLRVQNSEEISIHLLPVVYAIRDDEDWHDPAVWRRVNPSWGETVNPIEFERHYEDALKSGTNESAFLRYHLNRATKHESTWINTDYWIACAAKPSMEIKPIKEGFRYAAVDLSDHLDLTAFVEIHEVEPINDQPRIRLHTKFWAPTKPASRVNLERYEKWERAGLIQLIPGPVARQEVIEDDIIKWLEATDKQLPPMKEIGVDRFNATRFAYSMQEKLGKTKFRTGLRKIAYNAPTLNDAMKHLEAMIYNGVLLHDNSLVMRWMLSNCMAAMDSSGNRKLDKAKSKGKIDGFAALLMAVYMAINQEAKLISKYNTQELLVVNVRGG
jgi:phage terminase large subunit-like protein